MVVKKKIKKKVVKKIVAPTKPTGPTVKKFKKIKTRAGKITKIKAESEKPPEPVKIIRKKAKSEESPRAGKIKRRKVKSEESSEKVDSSDGSCLSTSLFAIDFILICGAGALFVLFTSCANPEKPQSDDFSDVTTSPTTMTTAAATNATTRPPTPTRVPEDSFNADPKFQCGEQQVDYPYFGAGDVKVAHTWPWIIGLNRLDAHGYIISCTATLVSPRHAITSVSCLEGMTMEEIEKKVEIRAKLHDGGTAGYHVEVFKARLNPGRAKIILLTLSSELPLDTSSYPVCLPPARQKMEYFKDDGRGCFTFGWRWVGVLKQSKAEFLSFTNCSELYSDGEVDPTEAFCASGINIPYENELCMVDNGGPIVCEEEGFWVLYGLLSDRGTCWIGNLYVQVSYAVNWLCCFFPNVISCEGVDCDVDLIYN